MIEDILDRFELNLKDIGLNEKEFDGETVSYVITHELERFPNEGEVMSFKILDDDKNKQINFKTLDILNGQMGHIEVGVDLK